ncbi:DUF3147 family protein [Niallia sp. XMNu-256]|uniref:DUF3147 family protein n=1 Tax=Niallia sp. XMNu-256 TaxID=3082444 RepID=UPI0030CBAC4F
MTGLSISALLIRFVIGGLAVVLATIVSKRLGEKAGGIFAAFPAVYLAALLTASLDFNGDELISYSILLSQGAIVGMVINIIMAMIAGYLIPKFGWKRELTEALGCWFIISFIVVTFTS